MILYSAPIFREATVYSRAAKRLYITRHIGEISDMPGTKVGFARTTSRVVAYEAHLPAIDHAERGSMKAVAGHIAVNPNARGGYL